MARTRGPKTAKQVPKPRIQWKQNTRILPATYKSAGRGKKEAFKNRRDTVLRKGHMLAKEFEVSLYQLIYNPRRDEWNVLVKNATNDETPPSLSKFIGSLKKTVINRIESTDEGDVVVDIDGSSGRVLTDVEDQDVWTDARSSASEDDRLLPDMGGCEDMEVVHAKGTPSISKVFRLPPLILPFRDPKDSREWKEYREPIRSPMFLSDPLTPELSP